MTEAAQHANFNIIRYAQVWEDADILLRALQITPEDECVSIASAGDNALAMLSLGPRKVVAIDMNPAQLACVQLRLASFRKLTHAELLDLLGVLCDQRDAEAPRRRWSLYQKIRPGMTDEARAFWDAQPQLIEAGAGTVGKFENYFRLFRTWFLPFIHTAKRVDQLLAGGSLEHRREFYEKVWDTRRWRMLFHIFFSRWMIGRFGRDPAFFRYVEGSVAERILKRSRHALTEVDTAQNSYLQWILWGGYKNALPYALRAENFERIRNHLERFECRLGTLEDYLVTLREKAVRQFNLSDIFEYMSEEAHQNLLRDIVAKSAAGSRLAYWNMLAPRRCPPSMTGLLRSHDALAGELHLQDKAFFYNAFILEEVQ